MLKKLFWPWYNTLITLCILLLMYMLLKAIGTWAFESAQWDVIPRNFRLFLFGQYPLKGMWRVWLCLYLLIFIVAITLLAYWKYTPLKRYSLLLCYLYIPSAILILSGFGGHSIKTSLWSGLLLTFILASISIVCSFPLGILLALGRRSSLPSIRWFCISYIELIRGLPLITVLLVFQIMLPLFLPSSWEIDRVLRAIVAMTLFSAAYMAENVRGGLQAISNGQYEAASALGLKTWQSLRLIILPQALRNIVPILVGHFIGIFKDTSLVAVIGLADFLGIAQNMLSAPANLGKDKEVYLFVGAVYWIFCFGLASISKKLERKQ